MADSHDPEANSRRPPFILGFTADNLSVPPESSISSVVGEPAPKRRKATSTTRVRRLPTVPKLKRTSSKLGGKVTKSQRELNSRAKGSNVERRPADNNVASLQNPDVSFEDPPPLPQTTKNRLEAFRYSGPSQKKEHGAHAVQGQSHEQASELLSTPRSEQPEQDPVRPSQGIQAHLQGSHIIGRLMTLVPRVSSDEHPPSYQPRNKQYLSSNEVAENTGPFIGLEDYSANAEDRATRTTQEEEQLRDPSWSDQLFQSSPSNWRFSKQPIPDPELYPTDGHAVRQCEASADDFDDLEVDDEEIAALVALTDSASASASPTKSSLASSPPRVSVSSTITTIPESSPSIPHSKPTGSVSPSHPQTPYKPITPGPSTIPILNQSPVETWISPTPSTPRSFVRSAHPKPALPRPLIPGISPTGRILTCFRLGEAINASSRAQREHHPIQVEVYLQVVSSTRIGNIQHFKFTDLWQNISSGTGLVVEGQWKCWSGVKQWEADAEAFLGTSSTISGQNKIARVIGRVERRANGGWHIEVGTCWEVSWKEVENVRDVVCS